MRKLTRTHKQFVQEIIEDKTVVTVRLKGNLTIRTLSEIARKIGNRKQYVDKNTLIDFNAVTGIDTATIASLLDFKRFLLQHEKKLGIIHAPKRMITLLSFLRLKDLLEIYSDEDSALQGLCA